MRRHSCYEVHLTLYVEGDWRTADDDMGAPVEDDVARAVDGVMRTLFGCQHSKWASGQWSYDRFRPVVHNFYWAGRKIVRVGKAQVIGESVCYPAPSAKEVKE